MENCAALIVDCHSLSATGSARRKLPLRASSRSSCTGWARRVAQPTRFQKTMIILAMSFGLIIPKLIIDYFSDRSTRAEP
jgi:hypothetical protein